MGYKLSKVADSLSFTAFAAKALKIINVKGQLQWLDPLTLAQLKVHSVLELQRQAGMPMRVLVLKARRVGVSTLVEGRFFREINRRPMRYACVCSADTDATNKVFKMTTLFQDEIPKDLKRKTDYSNRNEIVYSAPHRSQFLCQTAGKDVLGRGGLTHYLHATEFAFWARAKEQLGGAMQEIPDESDTIVVIESTANGVGGAFYDMYMGAVDKYKATKSLDGFVPVFLPWFIFPSYRRTPPQGWVPDVDGREVGKEFNLDNEQLYWREWAIENKCQGDAALFHQEYPCTFLEAFQSSGQPVFSQAILKFQERNIRKDVKWGLFDVPTGDFISGEPGFGWQVIDLANNEEHTIGADSAEYHVSDEKDPDSDRDYDAAAVLGRSGNPKRVKAIWRNRTAQIEFGQQILGAARHYNQAYVNPEIPTGMGLLQVLKDAGYPNIYGRQTKQTHIDANESDELGWRTTSVTRQWMTTDLITVLRADSLLVQFEPILSEMRTFIRDKHGRPVHMPGKHDDLIFAMGLALEADLACPKDLSLMLPERTGDSGEDHKKTDYDLATVGAYDNFDDDDDEWDDVDFWHTS